MKKDKPVLLSKTAISKKIKTLSNWQLIQRRRALKKDYLMKNFVAAVELIYRIMKIAEAADHHPDLHLTSYRKLKIVLSTHSAGGLTNKDFILASKIDRLPKTLKL